MVLCHGENNKSMKIVKALEDPPGGNLSPLTDNHQDHHILTDGGNAFRNTIANEFLEIGPMQILVTTEHSFKRSVFEDPKIVQ